MSRSNALRALAVSQLATTLLAAAALPFVPSSVRAQSATPEAQPQVRIAPPAADNAADEATELAKKLQNPIGDLYSFPFQGNTNFNTGTKGGTQEILNVQPVIPIHINDEFTVITRTILPLVWQPSFEPAHTVPFGTAPTDFSALLSNANPIDHWVFGAGPIIQAPTASDKTLGSNVWGAGPEAVAVYIHGPWVTGLLANNIWSFGGTSGPGGTRYTKFLIQPFANYNFGGGWYVFSDPEFTANWPATRNHAWTVPFGGGAGKVIKLFGKLPINLQLGAFYNAIRPSYTGAWSLRTQVTLIF